MRRALLALPMMIPKNPGRSARFLLVFAALLACGLLDGCRSDFHLVLFNASDDSIILRRRDEDPNPLVVYASTSGELTGVSTDDFSVERHGKVLHYRFPPGYTYPSASVPSGYVRRVHRLGRAYCFQLGEDNRIYILSTREPLVQRRHPTQPAGFPLVPYQVTTLPVVPTRRDTSPPGPGIL